MAVMPDSVGLIAAQTQRFVADGFDQFEQSVSINPRWSATGGTMDSTGLYTAGDHAGLFPSTATAPATRIDRTALLDTYSELPT